MHEKARLSHTKSYAKCCILQDYEKKRVVGTHLRLRVSDKFEAKVDGNTR